MSLASAKEATARRNRCPILSKQRRGGNRQAQVLGHERDHLPAGLQDRHVGIEVDPVQALDVQRHMPAEDLVHRHSSLCHDASVRSSRRSRDPVRPASDRARPHPHYPHRCTQPASYLAGPRLASLVLQ